MMRKCHLNTCPVGVATQDPELRKRFSGQPEHVVNFFFFIAEEVRKIMASMGISRFDDLVGRADLLDTRAGIEHWKAKGLDFSKIFHMPAVPEEVAIRHAETQDHGLERALDHELIRAAQPAIGRKEKQTLDFPICNVNRSAGAMLSGEIAKRHGGAGLPDGTLTIRLHGTAGQSFGAFLAKGVNFVLEGEGNDYVGKGLSGGRIVVRPPAAFRGETQDNIIVGNTVLYGATDGEAYLSGVGGERFAVRNSGATAVVEGVGDHGCEYMTGGTVVVLGQTGRNFGAGMSGGFAYVYDVDGKFASRCNMAQVALEPLPAEKAAADASEFGEDTEYGAVDLRHLNMHDEDLLKELIAKHVEWTGSQHAKSMLDHWDRHRAKFIKVMPHEYRRALDDIKKNAKVKEAV
jgi:glutamate synthase (NADPH/NADH) large chain